MTSEEPHKVRIISDGPAALALRLDMIERAQESIDFEVFVFRNDPAGRLIAQALARKAAAGVTVRLLMDAQKSQREINDFIAEQFGSHHIQLRFYNLSIFPISWLLHRNHRKILIVDRSECLMGGRNLGERNFGLSAEFNTTDREVWVRGPIVAGMHRSFEEFWDSDASRKAGRPVAPARPDPMERGLVRGAVSRRQHFRLYQTACEKYRARQMKAESFFCASPEDEALRREVSLKGQRQLQQIPYLESARLRFVSDEPMDSPHRHRVGRAIYDEIQRARESIILESPVFLLLPREKRVFRDLLTSGVSVRVFSNGPNAPTKKLIRLLGKRDLNYLADHRADVFFFCQHAIQERDLLHERARKAKWEGHSKSLVVDGAHTMIGTYNFEPYSTRINTEAVLFFRDDTEIAQVVRADIQRQLSHSHPADAKSKSIQRCPNIEDDVPGYWTYWLSFPAMFVKHWL